MTEPATVAGAEGGTHLTPEAVSSPTAQGGAVETPSVPDLTIPAPVLLADDKPAKKPRKPRKAPAKGKAKAMPSAQRTTTRAKRKPVAKGKTAAPKRTKGKPK